MLKQERTISSNLDSMTADLQALINATAGAAEDTVVSARARLAALIGEGQGAYERFEDSAVQSVKRANAVVHSHPYRALGMALGVGVVLGAMMRRHS